MGFTTKGAVAGAKPWRGGLPASELPGRNIIPKFLELCGGETPLGEAQYRQLLWLQEEPDPELLVSGLLRIGRQFEEGRKPELAAALYHSVASAGSELNFPVKFREEAEARFQALSGGGEFGRSFENLARVFAEEALQPAPLLAMGAASAAYRFGRLAYLSRIGVSELVPALARGWRLRAGATAAGFLAETTVFVGTQRLAQSFLPRDGATASRGLFQDWIGSALSLGSLKFFGHAAGSLAGRESLGTLAPGHLVREVLPEAGAFFGLAFGHQLERWAKLRPEVSHGRALEESLFSFLSLKVGSALSRQLLGPGFTRWEQEWNLYAEQLAEGTGPSSGERPAWRLALATGFSAEEKVSSPEPAVDSLLMFRKRSGGSGAGPRPRPPEKAWRRLFLSLKTLGARLRATDPNEQGLLLARLGQLFHQSGLSQRAIQTLQRAQEIAVQLKDPQSGADCFIEIAEGLSTLGHRNAALQNLEEAELQIQKLPQERKLRALQRLGTLRAELMDENAKGDFLQAAMLIDGMPENVQETYREELAMTMAQVGHLTQARHLLDRNRSSHRAFALASVGRKWAEMVSTQGDFAPLTFATTAFQEARATLLRDQNAQAASKTAYGFENLVTEMADSGPYFREEAREILQEYRAALDAWARSDENLATHPEKIPPLLAKVGDWEEGLALIQSQNWLPNRRSLAIKGLLLNLARDGKPKLALRLLRGERLYPTDRFDVLLGVAKFLPRGAPEQNKAVRRVLGEAKRLVLSSEFYPQASNRSFSLQRLARELASFPEERKALVRLLEEADRAMRQENPFFESHLQFKAHSSLEILRSLELPFLKERSGHWWGDFKQSAEQGQWRRLAWLGTALGFHRLDLQELGEKIVELPQESRMLAKAWVLYGMTLVPTEERAERAIVAQLERLLLAVYEVPSPMQDRTQLVLFQALRRLSPEALEKTLVERTRARLRWRQFPSLGALKSWGAWSEADPQDTALYQGLSYLARHGSPASKAMVSELVSLPHFPETWRPPLDRALAKHGYRRIETPRDLN